MNRRTFLKLTATGFVGACVVDRLGVVETLAEVSFPKIGLKGLAVFDLFLEGGDAMPGGLHALRRMPAGTALLHVRMTPGSMWRWVAAPDGEILLKPQESLEWRAIDDVGFETPLTWQMVARDMATHRLVHLDSDGRADWFDIPVPGDEDPDDNAFAVEHWR